MSILNAIENRARMLAMPGGKMILNQKFPAEFELYVIALELVDAEGKTLRYFIFPVNPSSIDETNQRSTNIKKTLAGVVTLATTSFIPIDINISGTFGRKFKVLLGNDYTEFLSSFRTAEGKITVDSLQNGATDFFDNRVKTGYGCLKILEEICNEVDLVDEKGPRRLLYYNLAFGSAYVVRPMQVRFNMSQENNMVHNYYVSFKAIAPIAAMKNSEAFDDDRRDVIGTNYVQASTQNVINTLSSIL